MSSYAQVFVECGMDHWVDVPNASAEAIAKLLITAGTSFAITAEPWGGEKRVYLSANSVKVIEPLLGLLLVRNNREE